MPQNARAQKPQPDEVVEDDTIPADFAVIIDNKDMWRLVHVRYLAHQSATSQRKMSRRVSSPVAATNGYKSRRRRHCAARPHRLIRIIATTDMR